MTRLHAELTRLYALPADPRPLAASQVLAPAQEAASSHAADMAGLNRRLVNGAGQVRALVLALAAPADGAALARVWQGVQRELDLPAPAVAVSGQHSCQLWFSVAQPVAAAQGRAFLQAVCRRYLADTPTHRLRLWPAVDQAVPLAERQAPLPPAPQPGGERWSAFVAADLAMMFLEEPWLDTPPNLDGQAQLLAGLRSMPTADLERAVQQLQPAPAAPALVMADVATATPTVAPATAPAQAPADGPPLATGAWLPDPLQPHGFLLAVMRDHSVPMHLRIEAAKALLPLGH